MVCPYYAGVEVEFVRLGAHACAWVCGYIYVCLCACVRMCACVCVYVFMCVCVCVRARARGALRVMSTLHKCVRHANIRYKFLKPEVNNAASPVGYRKRVCAWPWRAPSDSFWRLHE